MLGKKPSMNLTTEKSVAEHFVSTKRGRAKIDPVAVEAEAAATDGKHWGRLRAVPLPVTRQPGTARV
jgi:hypothetical protein